MKYIISFITKLFKTLYIFIKNIIIQCSVYTAHGWLLQVELQGAWILEVAHQLVRDLFSQIGCKLIIHF